VKTWRFAQCAAFALALLAAAMSPAWADTAPGKTLRVSFPIAETGFDPQAAGDAYSNYVNRAIFDPLYRYDYLARPYKLVPNTATGMPEISADGRRGRSTSARVSISPTTPSSRASGAS
jgi:ABC-type oligopeptide transport system substrate-binding subunit